MLCRQIIGKSFVQVNAKEGGEDDANVCASERRSQAQRSLGKPLGNKELCVGILAAQSFVHVDVQEQGGEDDAQTYACRRKRER